MSKKIALSAALLFAVVALAVPGVIIADGASAEEPDMFIMLEYGYGEQNDSVVIAPVPGSDMQNENKPFYDFIVALVIALAFAGYLHVKAHPKN